MMLRLHDKDPGDGEAPRARATTSEHTRRTQALRCARCGTAIAERDAIFAMGPEGARAIFANPHGRVFEIVTLRHAENVLAVTAPTTESSWFSEYAWRVVVCAGCSTHLGWSFAATVAELTPRTFHGLIFAALSDEPGEAN